MLASTTSARRMILVSVLTVFAGLNGNAGVEEMNNKEKLLSVTVTYPDHGSEKNTLLLVESIRTFAGSLAQAPVWCLVPQYGKRLSPATEAKLTANLFCAMNGEGVKMLP